MYPTCHLKSSQFFGWSPFSRTLAIVLVQHDSQTLINTIICYLNKGNSTYPSSLLKLLPCINEMQHEHLSGQMDDAPIQTIPNEMCHPQNPGACLWSSRCLEKWQRMSVRDGYMVQPMKSTLMEAVVCCGFFVQWPLGGIWQVGLPYPSLMQQIFHVPHDFPVLTVSGGIWSFTCQLWLPGLGWTQDSSLQNRTNEKWANPQGFNFPSPLCLCDWAAPHWTWCHMKSHLQDPYDIWYDVI